MTRLERLRAIETDGPITAPVWAQHLFKVMTSCTLAWLLYGVDPFGWNAPQAGLAAGYGVYILLRSVYMLRPSLAGDPTAYGWQDRAGDWLGDFALSLMAAVLGYAADAYYTEALILGAWCVVVWWVSIPHMRP